MAVTSLWPIKNHLRYVIDYACNPEKTTEKSRNEQAALHTVGKVLDYAAEDLKTESRAYVTGLHCREAQAAEQFMNTKRLWNKTGGRVCYHGYQSFRAEEVTAETAHAIGVKLAEELWGERFEVLVATHCNTGHYHNHFVINSVSFDDGKKFYNRREDYQAMRDASDRLCREYGLSVIERPQNGHKAYAEWRAEQAGQPTIRSLIRDDIDRAIDVSLTERKFYKTLREMGYEVEFLSEKGTELKYPKLKPPGAKGYFRFHKLDENYTPEAIWERIWNNQFRDLPFPQKSREEAWKARLEAVGKLNASGKVGLNRLFWEYRAELEILKEFPGYFRRVPISLWEDLLQLERFNHQTELLARTKIEKTSELRAYRYDTEKKVEDLEQKQRELRNAIKRADRREDTSVAAELRQQLAGVNKELKKLRYEVQLCKQIEERSEAKAEALRQLREEQTPAKDERNRSRARGRDEAR